MQAVQTFTTRQDARKYATASQQFQNTGYIIQQYGIDEYRAVALGSPFPHIAVKLVETWEWKAGEGWACTGDDRQSNMQVADVAAFISAAALVKTHKENNVAVPANQELIELTRAAANAGWECNQREPFYKVCPLEYKQMWGQAFVRKFHSSYKSARRS